MKISEIFKDEPAQWGYRGDSLLWREMGERLVNMEMPSTSEELKEIIEHTYFEATGYKIGHLETFQIERFKAHGMSSGGISPEFWVNRGIPILVNRHVKP